jgi:hypothetical protein
MIMRKGQRKVTAFWTVVVAFLASLTFWLPEGNAAKADPTPPLPLPSLTVSPPAPSPSIVPVPGPTVTKYITKPRPTVTKTIYKRVPVPGPTETIYITRQGPSHRVTVTAKPSPSVSVSPSPVVTKEPGKTITISKPKFIGISLGLLVLGIIMGLVAVWIAYGTGYKDSQRNEDASNLEFRDELFGKKDD